MAVVDELITKLSYTIGEGSRQVFESFKNNVIDLKGQVVAMSAAVIGASTAVAYMVKEASGSALELEKMAQATNMGVEELQEWRYAAEAAGGSAESVSSDLEMMMKSMSSPIPGELNMELLMLGVNAKNSNGQLRETGEVMKDLASKLSSMDSAKQVQWADKVGISNDTLMLLKKGRIGIEELQKEASGMGAVIPENLIKKGAEFKKNLDSILYSMKASSQHILLSFAPAFNKITQAVKKFILANNDITKGNLKKVIDGIGLGFQKFSSIISKIITYAKELIKPLQGVAGKLDVVKMVAAVVVGSLTALGVILAPLIIKFTLIGAAIAGAGAIIEDFIVYLNGGDSAIGKIIDKTNTWIDSIGGLRETIGQLGYVWKAIVFIFEEAGKGIIEVFDGIIEAIKLVHKASGAVGTGIAKIVQFFDDGDEENERSRQRANQIAKNGGIGQYLNANSSTNNNQKTNIYIQTGASGESVANSIKKMMPNASQINTPGGFAPSFN